MKHRCTHCGKRGHKMTTCSRRNRGKSLESKASSSSIVSTSLSMQTCRANMTCSVVVTRGVTNGDGEKLSYEDQVTVKEAPLETSALAGGSRPSGEASANAHDPYEAPGPELKRISVDEARIDEFDESEGEENMSILRRFRLSKRRIAEMEKELSESLSKRQKSCSASKSEISPTGSPGGRRRAVLSPTGSPGGRRRAVLSPAGSPGGRRRAVLSPAGSPESEKKPTAVISQEEFDRRIGAFVIDAMVPLNIVENEKFRNLFADLTLGLKVLSEHSLGRELLRKAAHIKEKITAEMSPLKFVCMTADVWSTKHRGFLGVTVHWIDVGTLERRSATLACRLYDGTHSYGGVTELLDDVRKEYSIPESKIVAVVTDNSINFLKAFKEFGVDFKTSNGDSPDELLSGLPADVNEEDVIEPVHIEECGSSESYSVTSIRLPRHVRCASHSLTQVCTSDAKKSITGPMSNIHLSAMGKCTALWDASGKPKSAEKIRNILKCELKWPCPTRWNSLYDNVVLLVNQKQTLNKVMEVLDLPLFEDDEIEYLEEYVTVTKPLALALGRLQGDRNSHYGSLLPTLFAVQKKLERLASSPVRHTRPLVDALLNGFTARFKNFLSLDQSANDAILATLSHPQFKNKWLTINPKTNTDAHRKTMRDMLVSALKEQTSCEMSPETPDQPTAANAGDGNDDFFEYASEPNDIRKENSCVEIEVLKFLSDGRTSLDMLHDYGVIRELFIKYNTVLPSSAPVERLFNYTGHIRAAKRGNLSNYLFEELALLKGNPSFA